MRTDTTQYETSAGSPQNNGQQQYHDQGANARYRDQKDAANNEKGMRSRSGGDQTEAIQKLKAMVTQVPQGQINPMPVMNQQNSPKYRSKTQGSNIKMPPGAQGAAGNYNKRQKQASWGLLGPPPDRCKGMKTLVLDLDETLVHSQFQQIKNPDFIIPVDIDGNICQIFVQKRPGVDNFLRVMAEYYEVVIFTASLSKYADPLMDQMDTNGFCTARLFREHCTFMQGVFTKDMSKIGRNCKDAMILDNSPSAYMLSPEQAVPIVSWYDDMKDKQLFDLIPLFIQLSQINDCREAIKNFVHNAQVDFPRAKMVCDSILERQEREKQLQYQQQQMLQQKLLKQQEAEQQKQIHLLNQKAASGKDHRDQTRERVAEQQIKEQRTAGHHSGQVSSKYQSGDSSQIPSGGSQGQSSYPSVKQKRGTSKQPGGAFDAHRQREQAEQQQPGDDHRDQEKDEHRNNPQQIGGDQHYSMKMASGGHSKSQSSKQKHTASGGASGTQDANNHKQPLINPWTPQGNMAKQQNAYHQKQDIHNQHGADASSGGASNMISLRNQNQLMPQAAGQRQVAHPADRSSNNHKRFQSTGGLSQTGSANIAGEYKKKNALASMQNVNHENFGQGSTDHQNLAYQNGIAGSELSPTSGAGSGTANSSAQQNGVTNITNIIYNFNLTPSQQLHKQQIEQQMLLQQQQQQNNSRHGASAGNAASQTQDGQQINGFSPSNQRRIALTQGGNRPGSSKRNSGNGVNYPLINNNQNQNAQQPTGESPSKNQRNMMQQQSHLSSLDRSQQLQVSQGLSIRESYKEQAQNIQNQIKRRPQTGGNSQQINVAQGSSQPPPKQTQLGPTNPRQGADAYNKISGAPQIQMSDQMGRPLHKKQANQSGVIPPQVNKRSISGASNKTQFNLNAIKGHSSTPKNQNLTSGIGSFRPSGGGLHLINHGAGAQRFGNQMKNMTQVINLRDHLPADLRGNSNNQAASMHHQRLYMAQQKLAKQLKLNTNNDSFMRYGSQKNSGNPSGISGLSAAGTNAGNITTTASQSKSNGHSLFNFGHHTGQNLSGYSVGQQQTHGQNDRSGASLRRSNKQRSHSSSNNAGITQNNIVFIGTQGNNAQINGQQSQGIYGGVDGSSGAAMIAISNKHLQKQMQGHGRNNSDIPQGGASGHGQRQQEFIKDQKLAAAESAIADQYATSMLQHSHGGYHTKNFQTNTNDMPESLGGAGSMGGGIPGISAMSQSYRNVGGAHNSSNVAASKAAQAQAQGNHSTNIYEKLRNSYQSPNQYMTSEIIGHQTAGVGASVGGGSFQHQKSPKVSGHGGIKQIKISGNAHTYSTGQGYPHHPHQKNVKIMLVGNNGSKGHGQQTFKANIVDQSNMQYIGSDNLPKTTKNNVSKFYGSGNGSQDLSGGFLNALSTPQNKQNSFRNDVIRGVPGASSNHHTSHHMDGSEMPHKTHHMPPPHTAINIRQSANMDHRHANNGSTTGGNGMQKNTNSQQFSNVQFNQNMLVGSKSRGAGGVMSGMPNGQYDIDTSGAGHGPPGLGEESMRLRQKMNGHSKSMSNAHGGAQYAGQNLTKER